MRAGESRERKTDNQEDPWDHHDRFIALLQPGMFDFVAQ